MENHRIIGMKYKNFEYMVHCGKTAKIGDFVCGYPKSLQHYLLNAIRYNTERYCSHGGIVERITKNYYYIGGHKVLKTNCQHITNY